MLRLGELSLIILHHICQWIKVTGQVISQVMLKESPREATAEEATVVRMLRKLAPEASWRVLLLELLPITS
jgi:hypothetical protein